MGWSKSRLPGGGRAGKEPCRLDGCELDRRLTGKVCSLTVKVMFVFKPSKLEDKAVSIACTKEHFVYIIR